MTIIGAANPSVNLLRSRREMKMGWRGGGHVSSASAYWSIVSVLVAGQDVVRTFSASAGNEAGPM